MNEKTPISFDMLLSNFKDYIEEKWVEMAAVIHLDYDDFYTTTRVKKCYSVPKEAEEKLKKMLAKHIVMVGRKMYLHKSVKQEIEEYFKPPPLYPPDSELVEDEEEITTVKKEKKVGGRPKKQIDKEKISQLKKEGKTNREIADELKISIRSLYTVLREIKEEE